LSSFSFSNKGE